MPENIVTERDLLVTEALTWFSSTPTLIGLFSEESRGKSSKYRLKSYKQPKNKVSRKERKIESTCNKETKEETTREEQNNLQKGRTTSMVL
jgi:hypothetical protein